MRRSRSRPARSLRRSISKPGGNEAGCRWQKEAAILGPRRLCERLPSCACGYLVQPRLGKAANDVPRCQPRKIGKGLEGFSRDVAFVCLPAHRDPFIEGLRFPAPSSVQELTSGVAYPRRDLCDDRRHNSGSAMLGPHVEPLDIPAVRAPEHVVDEGPLPHADHALATCGDEQSRYRCDAKIGLAQLRPRAGMAFRRMAPHEVVDHFLDVVQIRVTRRSDGKLGSRSGCHRSMWRMLAGQAYADSRPCGCSERRESSSLRFHLIENDSAC